ncbi:MAG: RelB antitoxin [Candidatus Parcubacteria bacterium]
MIEEKTARIDNVITADYTLLMNTTLQIRIDKKTKEKAQKVFKEMGIDLSAGIKMYLTQIAQDGYLSFIPSTKKTRAKRKEWDKEVAYALKHGKGYSSAEEMHDAILKEK